MDVDAFVQYVLSDVAPDLAPTAGMAAEQVMAIVDLLHAEVEKHFYINANRSLQVAGLVEQIGRCRNEPRITGLGMMKRGDSLRFLGQLPAAWEAFGEAGGMLLEAGDDVGWARTRIGRLLVCVDLNHVDEALADAERAREIFERCRLHDRLLVLDLNLGIVLKQRGAQAQALERYHAALERAETLGERGRHWLAQIHTNIGNVYHLLGDLRSAMDYHLRARALFAEREEASGVALAENNAAHIYMDQGHYRRALQLLHSVSERYHHNQLPLGAAFVQRDMTECFLLLNRYAEARDLAEQVSATFEELGSAYEQGRTLLHLATAEVGLHNYEAAQAALNRAAPVLAALEAQNWVGTAHLCRGRLAFREGDLVGGEREAIEAGRRFEATGQQVYFAEAALLRGQIALVRGDLLAAVGHGRAAQAIAYRCKAPPLRYATHLFLGKVAEAQGNKRRATRRYRAAVAVVERVQQGLTITLRPGFMGDKEEALRALIALHLQANEFERAFDTLERAKSQVLLNYLVNREQLQWRSGDARTRALLAELDHLRAKHHWLYGLANDAMPQGDSPQRAMAVDQAKAELGVCERRMRTLTEQLYLESGDGAPHHLATPLRFRDIQEHLDDETLLIEYYNDGANLWAFTLDSKGLEAHRLGSAGAEIDRLVAQLQMNINGALRAGSRSPIAASLSGLAQRLLQRLHAVLLGPMEQRLRGGRRLVIVPYGVLHYVPMHLLHNGTQYLIETAEVVVLPAAGLIGRKGLRRAGGARVLAHSQAGRLPHTLREATLVHELFDGELWHEDDARRTKLKVQPTQILHIAAHAEYRLDRPDLSYVELADGQVYADDLLQEDMSYELVTLSACETGRANVAAGDELIGLGRGFLYTGAGALLASLWRVADEAAVELMEQVYCQLRTGASKSAALRAAQCAIKDSTPALHPAFWGAFQLIGDARPLSGARANQRTEGA